MDKLSKKNIEYKQTDKKVIQVTSIINKKKTKKNAAQKHQTQTLINVREYVD